MEAPALPEEIDAYVKDCELLTDHHFYVSSARFLTPY
jgi:hypothetical protein